MPHRRFLPVALVALLLLSGTAAPLVRPDRLALAQGQPAGPAAQQLIAAAVETGQIDYGTSLLYRAYAAFGDGRLPDAFAGSGVFEDAALFSEIRLNWDRLSARTRDQLTPFIVRPNDPRSVFAAAPSAGATEPRAPGGDQTDAGCVDGWATATHADFPLKVWMPCTGDYTGDLALVLSIVDSFWQPEVDLMGPPKADTGTEEAGGDARIDLYVVDTPTDELPRNGGTQPPLNERIAALAIADDPLEGKTASGYMIARRPSVTNAEFPLVLAHEFFHVLQYAHNVTITWGFSDTPYGEFDILRFTPYWFFEASAKWVESYLYRGKVPDEVMDAEVHAYFTSEFHFDEPLFTSVGQESPLWLQIYAAYIWFFFVQQQVGPAAIGQIWRNLESVDQDDFAGTLAAIDAVLPFSAHFRDFAVRNLNLDLEPGDPISPSYHDFDPSFPEGIHPLYTEGKGLDRVLEARNPGEPVREVVDTIKPLSAHYNYFVLRDGASGVALDFARMTPADTLDIDLIVKIKDKGWERRQLPVDDPTTLCRSNPDDDVETFYLVLSNHSAEINGALGGSFTLDTSPEACA